MPKAVTHKVAVAKIDQHSFAQGQEYERAAIIKYIRDLKKHQAHLFKSDLEGKTNLLGPNPVFMQELLTAIEAELKAARHHSLCD